jgi:hypothetical protein
MSCALRISLIMQVLLLVLLEDLGFEPTKTLPHLTRDTLLISYPVTLVIIVRQDLQLHQLYNKRTV